MDSDEVAALHACGLEAGGEGVGTRFECGVGEGFISAADGVACGHFAGLGGNERVERRGAWVVARGGVPSFESQDFFLRAEDRQCGERGFAVGDDAFDQLLEGSEPAADGGLVVEIGVILALDDESLVGLDEIEEQVEIDELLRVGRGVDFQAVKMDLVDAGFVDVEHHGNERQAAGVARQSELLQQRAEGVILVVVSFENLLLHLTGEFAEDASAGGLEAQREEI